MNYERCIRETFQFLRQWSLCQGLNPAELLEVGVPVVEDNRLSTYTCCLEYVLPFLDENSDVSLGELPGGRYAIMRVEKTPEKIGKAVAQFNRIYMHDQHLVQAVHRPVYEIYYEHEMEYCVPLLG